MDCQRDKFVMREVKFEVIIEDNKELVGHERINADGHWEHIRPNRQAWLLGAITDGQEYMKHIRRQFTGLSDKNGKEIYEGDILSCDVMLVEIIYSANSFVGKFRHIKNDPNPPLENKNYLQWTVIGNIYQHPNLLK